MQPLLQPECLICFGKSSVTTIKCNCGCIANIHKTCLQKWRDLGNKHKCIVCGKINKPYRCACLFKLMYIYSDS